MLVGLVIGLHIDIKSIAHTLFKTNATIKNTVKSNDVPVEGCL